MDFFNEYSIELGFGFLIVFGLILFLLLKISERNEAKSKKAK